MDNVIIYCQKYVVFKIYNSNVKRTGDKKRTVIERCSIILEVFTFFKKLFIIFVGTAFEES